MLFPVYFCKRKAEPTVQPCWLRFFRTEDAFCLLVREVLRHEGLGGGARQRKAQAARSDCEGDGASDVKALFALQEEVKPPNNLAAGAGS
ncbi:hypothetical protein COC45_02505 [Bacillus cereus]|nr:hypothetical protein CN431_05890 [Bacillus cereus]PFI54805.1 hypothetical protein COI76_11755 [Bacillus cereus]PFM05567.1 hypothetical protein COJ40_24485 [Bacillus cereus]PGS16074.1 hypothetical protein COC45_02505 [Bacillus cereus]PGT95776.1 hypothetical protein COD18_01410 [Bacillus cereus]